MPLFGNKKDLTPPLTHFHLSLNVTKIEEWLDKPSPIGSTWKTDRFNNQVETYPITLLPVAEYLFFHQRANKFATSIAGFTDFGSNQELTVNWTRDSDFFYVIARQGYKDKSHVIFATPWGEILQLLVNREISSTNFRKEMDGTLVDISEEISEGNFSQISRRLAAHDAVDYSNDLAILSVTCERPSDIVSY